MFVFNQYSLKSVSCLTLAMQNLRQSGVLTRTDVSQLAHESSNL